MRATKKLVLLSFVFSLSVFLSCKDSPENATPTKVQEDLNVRTEQSNGPQSEALGLVSRISGVPAERLQMYQRLLGANLPKLDQAPEEIAKQVSTLLTSLDVNSGDLPQSGPIKEALTQARELCAKAPGSACVTALGLLRNRIAAGLAMNPETSKDIKDAQTALSAVVGLGSVRTKLDDASIGKLQELIDFAESKDSTSPVIAYYQAAITLLSLKHKPPTEENDSRMQKLEQAMSRSKGISKELEFQMTFFTGGPQAMATMATESPDDPTSKFFLAISKCLSGDPDGARALLEPISTEFALAKLLLDQKDHCDSVLLALFLTPQIVSPNQLAQMKDSSAYPSPNSNQP